MSKLPFPAYCHHRATDQAFCTVRQIDKRKVHYLGPFGSENSVTKFGELLRSLAYSQDLITKAVAHARETISKTAAPVPQPATAPDALTVYALYNSFQKWAPTHYRLPNGEVSREVDNFRDSFKECLDLLGARAVDSLIRADLLAVRQRMLDRNLSRKVINQRISRTVRVFVWGGDEDRKLVPDSVAAAFRLVKPLQPFRGGAVEREAVEAVPLEDLKKVLDECHPVIAAMLRLQLHAALRPGEVRALKRRMVKEVEGQWVVDFERAHKMAYRGRPRVVPLGPQARALLEPWLKLCTSGDDCVFRPDQAPKAKNRHRGLKYTGTSYTTAVQRACARAGVVTFGPNRVRHLAATEIRREFGLEAAQAVLGHSHYSTTERYAPVVSELASEVANKRG